MSAKTGIQQTKNGLTERLKEMMTRAASSQGAGARIFPLYQKLQTKRFETENASEGTRWPQLNPVYQKYKVKRFGGGLKRDGKTIWGSYPGSGKKMLIGTSTLAGAVIGRGSPFEGTAQNVQIYKPYSVEINVNTSGNTVEGKPFNYAAFVAEKRPFMEFGDKSIQEMKNAMRSYLIGEDE